MQRGTRAACAARARQPPRRAERPPAGARGAPGRAGACGGCPTRRGRLGRVPDCHRPAQMDLRLAPHPTSE
eukprot:353830-Chlamydomonas_euryale.AAC.17